MQQVSRRQTLDAREEAPVGWRHQVARGEHLDGRVVGSAHVVDRLRERANVGAEHEALVPGVVVERLLAEAVAGERERLVALVPDRQREHAVQSLQRAGSPLAPRVQQHLPVPFGRERMTEASELVAKLAIVVDLAVEHQVQAIEVKRLVGAWVQIDHRQAAKRKARSAVVPDPLVVGPAVRHRAGHPRQDELVGPRAPDDSGDPAHTV